MTAPHAGRTGRASRPGLLLPRHPGDAVRVALAVALLVLAAVFVHRDRVGTEETNVFRLVNDLPGALFPLLWPVMQLGNIVAVPIAAAIAAGFRRFRLAAEILLAGTGVWLLAKLVKQLVQRGRPASLLPDVHIHGGAAAGRGYLSGHAAVAFAIATLVAPYLPRRARRSLWAVVIAVCVARVYVGAHLPLDVVAGAALGWGVASLVHLLLGAPSGRPSRTSVRKALTRLGVPVNSLQSVDPDSRRSARFLATTDDGTRLYVKVIPRDRRDHDLLYRAWLALTRRGRGLPKLTSPGEQAEREAAMGLAAATAGVRTPPLVTVGSSTAGTGVLVHQWVDGSAFDGPHVGRAVLADLRDQVARLHGARIAHGQLRAANVLVDEGGRVWLVDFSRARTAASAGELAADLEDVVAMLTPVAGATTADDALASLVDDVRRIGSGRSSFTAVEPQP